MQLHDLRSSLQKYFYSARVNIGFHTAYNKRQAILFQNKIAKAIEIQVLHIANADKVYDIIRHREKINDRNLLLAVSLLWLSLDNVINKGEAVILGFLLWAGEQGGQVALDKMVPDRVFNLTNTLIKTKLVERTDFLVNAVDSTTQKWVAQTIENALKQGWDVPNTVFYLKEQAKKISQERAELITETELINAMNLVEMEAFKRNSILKHKWVTSEDEKVEELCLANEAAGVIKVGDMFPSGTESPPAHFLCRCYLLPVLPEVIEGKIWTGE